MIIEADLADGDDARTLRQRAQPLDRIVRRLVDFAGMNADRRPDIREILGQLDRARARIDPRADGNDLRHARVRRARNHLRAIGIVIGVIEMGVGIDQHGLNLAALGLRTFPDTVDGFRDRVGGQDAAPGDAGIDQRAAPEDRAGIDHGVAADLGPVADERAELAQAGGERSRRRRAA